MRLLGQTLVQCPQKSFDRNLLLVIGHIDVRCLQFTPMDLEFHGQGKENAYHKVYLEWDTSFNTNEKIQLAVS